MGTVALGIGISLGSVETVLHIFIEANFSGIIGVGIGISRQSKPTLKRLVYRISFLSTFSKPMVILLVMHEST